MNAEAGRARRQPARQGALVSAARVDPGFSHRSWSIAHAGRSDCLCFFVADGVASLVPEDGESMELMGPAVVWIPLPTNGVVRMDAGSSGFTFSAAEEFVWRTVGDSVLAADMRAMMDQLVIATAEDVLPVIDELWTSFAGIVREVRVQQPGANAITGFHLGVILLHLWRSRGAAVAHGGGATTIQRFRQLVELHFREGLGVEDYARSLNVTRSHLHEACMRLAGQTPLAIIHARLIEEARTRLEQTDMSVEQVGYSLGFRDPAYFNRFFRRLTGQTPGAFRKSAFASAPAPGSASFAAWP
ncbi:helix-turn-helix domain-containing protein [Mesorhizobium sp. L-8-10]|uniref:helix-turn-helix domain-containing protein n=1 Tax=Mesorhizobium sp. L-8-10 TaxID=2744523 RepID=UPI0019257989|nr:helix-turn-helix domain-containing protein [Mesorhizobium sp. L-8-10]